LLSDWLTEILALFFGTFLHEDVSIVAAALFIVEHDMPWLMAFLAVLLGVVASDLFIYGLGFAARRIGRLQTRLIGPRVTALEARLKHNLVPAVAACRLMPGVLFPTFIACGWFGVSFWRFALTCILTATIYTPIVLALVVTFGHKVLQEIGYTAWIFVLVLIMVFTLYSIFNPVRKSRLTMKTASHNGLPPLWDLRRIVVPAERIPAVIFYLPVVLHWLWLSLRYRSLTLPTIANPDIPLGGLWGESKSELMDMISGENRQWLADYVALLRSAGENALESDYAQAMTGMREHGLDFPVAIKPDIGWQGYGVRQLAGSEALRQYLANFPAGERLLIQQMIPWDAEAGVYYAKMPGEQKGRILSMAFRYFPFVVGDGSSNIRQLIEQQERARFKAHYYLRRQRRHRGLSDEVLATIPTAGQVVRLSFIGSIRVGGLYRDAGQYITPALTERFNAICEQLHEFHFGRFDIRFASVEKLQAAEDFAIIEINGAGSEPIHAWDPDKSMLERYRELFHYQSMLFRISDRNRQRGYKPASLREFYRLTRKYQKLLPSYPSSE
jgi:membrane protein DedA with SNARE-associated domain